MNSTRRRLPAQNPNRLNHVARVCASSGGFTLLEVIVALAVLTIGIAGILRAFSAGMATVRESDNYSHAALLANRVAAELDHDSELEAGTQSGTFEDDTAYSWEAEVGAADDNDLMRTVVTITWGKTGKSNGKTFSLVTYLRTSSSSTDSSDTSSEEE